MQKWGGGYFLKNTNKNKGFTLVELLAVIVILAVIALIATPIILNIVNDAKKSAAKDSAYGYIEAIEYSNSLGKFSEDYGEIKDGTYRVSELSSDLSFKGNKPTYGNVTIEKRMVTSANLCIGGYMVNYDGKEATVGSKCIETEDTTGPNIVIGTISGTTNRLKIRFKVEDPETGIESVKCYYTKEKEFDEEGTIKEDVCTFKGLNNDKEYEFKIVAVNRAGMKNEKIGNTKTGATSIAFSQTKYPTDTEYSQYKNIGVTFSSSNVTNPAYYVKTTVATTSSVGGIACGTETDPENCSGSSTTSYAANTWYKVTSSPNIKFTANGTLYARVNDGEEYSSAETLTITKIDTTAPNLTLGDPVKTTKAIKIPITASDLESGIASTICKYGTSTSSMTSNGIVSNNICTISGNANTTYYYKVVTTNGSGLTKEETGNTKTGATSIAFSQTKYPTDTEYSQYKNIGVTFSSSNLTNSVYYVKTTVATTSSVEGVSCGTETDPGTCSGSSTTSYAANTWYKVTSNPNIKFTSTGTIYARINDGESYSSAETITITKIDTTAPNLTLGDPVKTTKTLVIPIIASDLESGIASTTCVYGTSTSYGSTGTVSNNACTFSGNANTTYYYKVVTTNGSELTKEETGNTETGATSIAFSQTQYPTDTEYAQYKNVTVTFSASNVTSPVYYVKTTVATTSTVGGIACGKETDPENCTGSSTTSYAANTWYKVTSSPNIKFTANGTLYARVNDGATYSSAETITITKIDSDKPNCSLSVDSYDSKNISVLTTCDNVISGIKSYKYSIDGNTYVSSTSNKYTFNGFHASTIKVKVTNNVSNTSEITLSSDELNKYYNNIYILLNNMYNDTVNNAFLTAHPIGSIYMTTKSDESTISQMASKYGGTWEVYAGGMTIAGYSSTDTDFNTINKTGGSKNISLSTTNIPSHTHTIGHTHTTGNSTISSSGSHTHSTTQTTINNVSLTANSSGNHTHTMSNGGALILIDTSYCTSGWAYNVGIAPVSNGGLWGGWNKQEDKSLTSSGNHTHTVSGSVTIPNLSVGSSGAHQHTVPARTSNSQSSNSSGNTGSGNSFSNLDPYIVVYMYRRVS